MNTKLFSQLLKSKRIKRGLSQKELASTLNMSASELCKIESNFRQAINIDTFVMIIKYLDFQKEEINLIFNDNIDYIFPNANISDIFTKYEISRLLSLNLKSLNQLKEYIYFLTSNKNKNEVEAINTLIHSLKINKK